MYLCIAIASNDHAELQKKFNTWLQQERPARIHQVELVADGNVYTYVALVVYVPAATRDKKSRP